MKNRFDISDQTAVSMPMKNLIAIVAAVVIEEIALVRTRPVIGVRTELASEQSKGFGRPSVG